MHMKNDSLNGHKGRPKYVRAGLCLGSGGGVGGRTDHSKEQNEAVQRSSVFNCSVHTKNIAGSWQMLAFSLFE